MKIYGNILFKIIENFGIYIIELIVQIILARLILPDEYGLYGLASVFIMIANIVINHSLTNSIINRSDITSDDSTVIFLINLILGIFIYGLLFFNSMNIALFYNDARLSSVIRLFSLVILIYPFASVNTALLMKNLQFKEIFFINIFSSLIMSIISVFFATKGYGIYSLIYAKIIQSLISTILIVSISRFKISLNFNFRRIIDLLEYSIFILFTNLINIIFNNLYSLIIGKVYNFIDLGLYQKGQQFPQLIVTSIDNSVAQVFYPVMSKKKDSIASIKDLLSKSIGLSYFILLPLLFYLFALAPKIVLVLFGEHWLGSVMFLRIQIILCFFWPFSARVNALNALGFTKLTFKVSLFSKFLNIFFIICFYNKGIETLMLTSLFTSIINFFVISYYCNKYIAYNSKDVIIDIYKELIASYIMFFLLNIIEFNVINIFDIVIKFILGMVLYLIIACFMKCKTTTEFSSYIKEFKGRV